MTPLEVVEAVFPAAECHATGHADALCQMSRAEYDERARLDQWTWWGDHYISYATYLTGEVS